jgi:hypothetical protein
MLRELVVSWLGWLLAEGIDTSSLDAAIKAAGMKSQFSFQTAIYNYTTRFARYISNGSGNYSSDQWTRDFASAIRTYLTEAWFEGMADNSLTHDDMTPEWQALLDQAISSEMNFLPDLGYWIAQTVLSVKPVESALPAIRARLDMWANRWLDVKNQAIHATAEPFAKEIWIKGDTEHCPTCNALNGLVAYVTEWDQAGFHPQNPPNKMLLCKGYKCGCRRVGTTARRSPNVLTRLLDIAASQGI